MKSMSVFHSFGRHFIQVLYKKKPHFTQTHTKNSSKVLRNCTFSCGPLIFELIQYITEITVFQTQFEAKALTLRLKVRQGEVRKHFSFNFNFQCFLQGTTSAKTTTRDCVTNKQKIRQTTHHHLHTQRATRHTRTIHL